MISSERALALAAATLNQGERDEVAYLDGCIESAVYAHFQGAPFGFPIPAEKHSMKVVAALKRLYEGGGWKVDVAINRGTYQLTFTPMPSQVPGISMHLPASRTYHPCKPSEKPRVALVSDVPGWAFDRNMRDLADALGDRFQFTHCYVDRWLRHGERYDWDEFDVIFEVFHRNPPMGIPRERAVSSLRSQWFRPEKPGAPTPDDIALVNSYRAFHVTTKGTLDELSGRCPRAVYLTNPIATQRFSQTPLRDRIVAEWNGNAAHQAGGGQFVKHFHDVIVPACKRAGVPLLIAEYHTPDGPNRRRTFDEMPTFYQEANIALCASEVEGASNSILEAMASGLAVVATDVGNHREMRDSEIAHFGASGIILVDRSIEAFVEALQSLTPARAHEMGEINRQEIIERWSWDAWADRYADFLRMAL